MGRRIYSLGIWIFMALRSLALFPLALLIWAATLPFDRRRRLRAAPPSVMVANHLFLLDILVLFRTFAHFKWVSKIEVFRVPLIGWNMVLNGYIGIRRGDRASVLRMMAACEKALARGNSVMLFPEGTRFVISGTADALPKRVFVLRGRYPISVRALDPLPVEELENLGIEELSDRVRGRMAQSLGEPGS